MTSSATNDPYLGVTLRHTRSSLGRGARIAFAALLAGIVIGTTGTGTSLKTGDQSGLADPVFAAAASPAGSTGVDASTVGAAELMAIPTTIKLRRLHLVRPDLLPYPIQLEVYC